MMGICQRVAYLLSPISSYSRHIIEAVREGDAGEQAPNVVQAPIFIMHGHRRLGKVGKVKWIYIAHSREALRHGSQFYSQITPCLPLSRKRSPDGATTNR